MNSCITSFTENYRISIYQIWIKTTLATELNFLDIIIDRSHIVATEGISEISLDELPSEKNGKFFKEAMFICNFN